MFSDRWRWAKLLLVIGSLAALGWVYTDFALHRPVGYRMALASPVLHDGAPLRFPLWRVSAVDGPGRFSISRTLRDVPILGPTEGLTSGDTVSIVGRFRAEDGVVLADEVHRHGLRPAKEALSLLALLWAFLMVPRCFGWRDGRVVRRG